jgi:hypothetical protein
VSRNVSVNDVSAPGSCALLTRHRHDDRAVEARPEPFREHVVGAARGLVRLEVAGIAEAHAQREHRDGEHQEHHQTHDERGPRAVLDDAAPPVPELLLARLRLAAGHLVGEALGERLAADNDDDQPDDADQCERALLEQHREQQPDRDHEHPDRAAVASDLDAPAREAEQRREQGHGRDHHHEHAEGGAGGELRTSAKAHRTGQSR